MNRKIGKTIAELRKKQGLTQEQLGEMLGISGQAVSKWEHGDSLPDVLLIPRICEVLFVTADELLSVPSAVQKKNCLSMLSDCARAEGFVHTAYEAVCACSYLGEREHGGVRMDKKGIKLQTPGGLALVLSGEDAMKRVMQTDRESMKRMWALLSDEAVLAVAGVLGYGCFREETDIAQACGLSSEETGRALWTLLKTGVAECDDKGRYVFGHKSYILFALLSGFYIASSEGYGEIGHITCSYME